VLCSREKNLLYGSQAKAKAAIGASLPQNRLEDAMPEQPNQMV